MILLLQGIFIFVAEQRFRLCGADLALRSSGLRMASQSHGFYMRFYDQARSLILSTLINVILPVSASYFIYITGCEKSSFELSFSNVMSDDV